VADFLFELGTEELPAAMLEGLRDDLSVRVREGLETLNLPVDSVRSFAAPRRLGVLVSGLPARQEDRTETVVGPALTVARDPQGNWTKAAEGFARKQGVPLTDCNEVEGPKGLCIGFTRVVKGRETAPLLAELLPAVVEALHLPKAMRWGSGDQLFVRAVRWVVALLDDSVVPMTVKGVASGRASRGHRLHGAASVEVPSAGAYFETLKAAFVLADPETREGRIRGQLAAEAGRMGGNVQDDSELVAAVSAMNEYPTVLAGDIPEEFLSLPAEVLVTCLREHQKFFVVVDAQDTPLPHFLAVMEGPKDGQGFVRRGYENVSRARLADARFFYDHDAALPSDRRLEELKGVVFHPRLGSYHDKALRLEALARRLAQAWGADADAAGWAALHCKADLVSLLVQEKEFTDLQGVAGGLYARAQGLPEAQWQALYDHYKPAGTGDSLPRGTVGACVAVADKLDTLMEMFRIGQAPSGSKDPFALRRAALGLMRILVESRLPLDLPAFLSAGGPALAGLLEFLEGRLRYLWEERNLPYDEINAALAAGLTDPVDAQDRLDALHKVRTEHAEDFDALSVAFKRAKNILKGQAPRDLDPARFLPEADKEGAGERGLHAAYLSVKDDAERALERLDYTEALRKLAAVRPAVDRFFDDVLVMADPEGKDPEKTARQDNRLALLQRLVALFDRVADFSQIVPRQAG